MLYFLPILFGILSFIQAHAQTIRFERLGMQDGLSSDAVNCVFQDKEGFLWVGTQNGLNRYDGYNFVVYKKNKIDSISISDNTIRAIAEDYFGNMWIGTHNGLNKLIRRKNSFKQYKFSPYDAIAHKNINVLFLDSHYQMWIGSEQGLSVFKPHLNHSETLFDFREGEYAALKEQTILSIHEDKKGNIWVGTSTSGVFKISPTSKKYYISHYYTGNSAIASDFITGISSTSKGEIWVSTIAGISIIDDNSNQIRYFSPTEAVPSSTHTTGMCIDASQKLWISTFDNVILQYDLVQNQLQVAEPLQKSSTFQPQQYASINAFYEDQFHTLWVGTWGGLYKYEPFKAKFGCQKIALDSIKKPILTAIQKIPNCDSLWIGTERLGLLKTKINQNVSSPQMQLLPQEHITSLALEENKIWVGTRQNGIFCLQQQEKKQYKEVVTDSSSFSMSEISNLFKDAENDIWGLSYQGVLCRYDKQENRFKVILDMKFRKNRIAFCVSQDGQGNFWIGSYKGFYVFNPKKNKIILKQETPFWGIINTIIPISPTKIWLATSRGLILYNLKLSQTTIFNTLQGVASDMIYAAVEDKRQNLWLSTNKGIAFFDSRKQTFRNFDISNGLQDHQFCLNAYTTLDNNQILLGGIYGYNLINPDSIPANPFAPIIIVSEADFRRQSSLHTPIFSLNEGEEHLAEVKKLELHQDDFHTLDLKITPLHFSDPKKNLFYYKIEGYDTTWQVGNWTKMNISYPALPVGEYTLKIKACNADGVFTKEQTFIKIYVHRSLWASKFLILLFAFLCVSGIYGIWKVKKRYF